MKNLFKNIFLLVLGITLFLSEGSAQEHAKFGFQLTEFLKTAESNAQVPLLVEGDALEMEQIVKKHGGNIRLQVDNLFSLEIPAANVHAFSQEKAIALIEFSNSNATSFSDTMLIQTNVDSVINQFAPLREKYTGKGVVLGVIDSGIELAHPDFKDSTGRTRVMYIWDQGVAYNPNRQALNYTYGIEWDSTDINAGISTHDDKANEFGHGSNVTGAAASNGLASGQFRGVAPEVNIITIATDFSKPNWLQTVAEATDYIYKKADEMGMPCVINASVGTYIGSHDGKDIAARIIDALVKQKAGRAFVCAAGNAGNIPFHLQQNLQNDTVFSWFESHPGQWSGAGGAYFEVWSDTNNFNALSFSIGADAERNGNFSFRGRTAFSSIQNRLNTIFSDSIIGSGGQKIVDVYTYAEESQGRYKLEVAIVSPDSSDYLFRFETRGTGKLDVWSDYNLFRHNTIKRNNLPSVTQFPDIKYYQKSDTLQTIVSSFSSLPSVITVGNYTNRSTYTDVSGTFRQLNLTPGAIAFNSSLGPNRNNFLKPDISSAGDIMFGSGRLATIASAIHSNPTKISADSLHWRNGGTSMAAPTVAGMVALYLQMCPKATNSQIKTDLLSSAKTDNFTATTPNFTWGQGKADAFNFLKKQSYSPSIVTILPNLCEGDSLPLSVNGSYQSYSWNTGDSTASIVVNQNGKYFAKTENSLGCISPTDTFQVNFNPLPLQPVVNQNGNTLSINASGSYLWYYNNNPLPNETNASITVQNNGNYFCEFTDANGCSINSDTVNVTLTGLEKFNLANTLITPNPSTGKFKLSFNNQNIPLKISIYSLSGKLIYSENNAHLNKQMELNLSHINGGIYFLQLDYDATTQIKKLVFE